MQVNELCRIGYFDDIVLDSYIIPVYSTKGITLQENSDIEEILESISLNVTKIRLNILGEVNIRDDTEEMHDYRINNLKLDKVRLKGKDRYTIGYVEILILKKQTDISILDDNFIKAIDKVTKRDRECKIAIIDRVFINKEFRQCKISTWIHNNLKGIAKAYGLNDIKYAMLTVGDFKDLAVKDFGLTKNAYEDLLYRHYKNLGYKIVNKNFMYKKVQ